MLDIGVGWGRVYRAMLRETLLIVGIDPLPRCIELCREAFPDGKFELVQPQPPYQFADEAFDVVYLYSVFSHLNRARVSHDTAGSCPRRQKRRVCRVHDAAALGLGDARVFQRMGG